MINNKPINQPDNRFKWHNKIPKRKIDPLPSWLKTPLKRHWIILQPNSENDWESKYVFNPWAILKNNKVYLFYRAEDKAWLWTWHWTSRIWLAISEDGYNFKRQWNPIFIPQENYEIPWWCEDPRILQIENGQYIMTYTAYDWKTARLALTISDDLLNWKERRLIFNDNVLKKTPIWLSNNPYWTKAWIIIPKKIHWEYIMYFWDKDIYIAKSKDLKLWTYTNIPIVKRRKGYFDEILCEVWPTPWIDNEWIHLLYNGDSNPYWYSLWEVVFNINKPSEIIRRSNTPFILPTKKYEIKWQVWKVIFVNWIVFKDWKIFIYYWAWDWVIALATGNLNNSKLK